MDKIAAIIQARMSSSRLPGKVLIDIQGQPMLARVVERVQRAGTVSETIVATTLEQADDPIANFCQAWGCSCFRGSLNDVLDRFYQAARQAGADILVRITADCPLVDPDLIDLTVARLYGFADTDALKAAGSTGRSLPVRFDFAANRLPPPWGRTYPIGLDIEVCTFAALEQAWKEADSAYQREHVMPFLYEDSPVVDSLSGEVVDGPKREFDHHHPFRVLLVNHPEDYGALRWTVDTPQDLEFIREIYARLPVGNDFSWLDVLAILENQPELARINAGVVHKTAFDVDGRS
jgi:spore coat polysaccharide biosynthesis protein SpsF